MKIIWFSEIKWSYLRTRKQHILANFDDSDEILFIEPVSFNLKNKFNISIEKNIKYVTVPQIQNSDIKFLNYFIHYTPIKFVLKFLSKIFLNRILKQNSFEPDIIITSNIFWIDYIKALKKKNNLNIIYDCNDNPLAFPNALNKNDYFHNTLNYSDHIIIPFKSYQNFISEKYRNKIEIISNGVDSKLLNHEDYWSEDNPPSVEDDAIADIAMFDNKPIIMYTGSIDTRLDYKLFIYLANELHDINFVFVGDIKRQIKSVFNNVLDNNQNFFHFSSIPYALMPYYLSHAKVCIIPFEKNYLSSCILPNKIFEYSALEKPFIMTKFNSELKDLHSDILIAKNRQEFKQIIINQIADPYSTENLKNFAESYNWSDISKKYRSFLLSVLKK